ncbi:MAG: hypothetical protein COB53_11630, partial [Elusimicrobia bacterium]
QQHSTAQRAEKERLVAEARATEQEGWEEAASDSVRESELPDTNFRVSVMSISDAAPRERRVRHQTIFSDDDDFDEDEDDFTESKVDTHWTVSGNVYNLVSLKPVRGLHLTFVAKSGGKKIKVMTNQKGIYKVRLPKKGKEYTMRLQHRKYDGTYVEESGMPFSQQSRDRRLDHYQTFRQSPILHVPLTPLLREDTIDHSFVMLPD